MSHGRSREVSEVARAVDRLTGGQGGALVLRGDSGLGKSALLDVAVERARQRSVRVLAATGVQSETQLPFAGLHQVLEPVLDLADLLPQQQRNALLGAFGIARDGAADLFLTALLETLAETTSGSLLRPLGSTDNVRIFCEEHEWCHPERRARHRWR